MRYPENWVLVIAGPGVGHPPVSQQLCPLLSFLAPFLFAFYEYSLYIGVLLLFVSGGVFTS